MRRLVLGLMVVALAGCNPRDIFKPNANAAAVVGGTKLTPDRLADFIGEAKGAQFNRETADFITNVWVDYTLFAQAVAKGVNLKDSAMIANAMWPQITELKATIWHDSLMARRIKVTPEQVSQLYDAGDIRIFQHILIRTGQTATPEEKAAAHKTAQMALNAIKAGTPFSVEASKMSMDPGSARDSGYLPAGPKGRFVPQFDSVAWALAPGAMSGLVDTPFGVHIIRRPPLAEVRDRFDAYLKQSQVAAIDSLYMDSLALHKDLKIEKTAPLLIKTAMADPDKSSTSQKALATYTGGALSVQEFLRWVRVLPPQVTGQLKTAPDSMLTRFVKILATNVLLVNEADSAGIKPSAEEWADMVHQYTVQIDSTKAALDLGAATDSSGSLAERLKVAALKVDAFMDQILTGARRFVPVPQSLGMELRKGVPVQINDAGVARALEIGRARQAAKDTTHKPDSTPGAIPMRPAPGPAPVPGGATGAPAPASPAPGH